ncbi:restriction endonuclease subunit S [Pseudomonas anguilliseptica]|uniref:Type I restriction enzyme, S subunit n=2 Tax=Pseudomonas anguilliseptica TaxID=53406 RepID=A0A1H4V3J7_PSEAG|nr:restriction endonuclease subunit S [Pseudomonas anguilliseptica]SEC75682.1 type I restriction enzyme, S subunit [Pseudomonas anguilliseptica]
MVPKGWQSGTLGDLSDTVMGYAFKSTDFVLSGIPLLRMGNLYQNQLDLDRSPVFLPDSFKTQYSKFLVKEGDLVMSMTGTMGKRDYGFTVQIPDGASDSLLNQRVIKFITKKDADPVFLLNLLRSELTLCALYSFPGGTKQANLSAKQILNLPALIPPIAEQTKIAQVLSSWDKAIAITERLLANSQQQKDMLTNQLLTGQQRFSEFVTSKDYQHTFHGPIPSDWSYVPIADIANQQSKANSTQADLPVLSCSKYDGLVDSLKYFKKKVYSDDTSKYRVVEFGDFAYPSNHIEEGSIGYQDVYPAGIVSPIYTVFRTTDAVDDYFLYRTLKTDKYRQIFSAATSASVDRRGSLRWKEFSKIQVPLPPLAEQQKIAQVLSTADAEIANLQAQLAKLKLEKKALMQQLLTGQRRVKLDAETAA